MHSLTIGRVQKKTRFRTTRYKTTISLKKIGNKIKTANISLKSVLFLIIISSLALVGLNTVYSRFHDTINHYLVSAEADIIIKDTELYPPTITSKDSSTVKALSSHAFSSNISIIDKRAYVLDEYFRQNDSPLFGTGKLMVEACDKYGAPSDCLILAAIARNETNLCKYSYSKEMHNCWGYGGGGVYRITFSSFNESIDRVTKTLMEGYGPKYINDPTLMETTFCGSEPGCTGWGNKIKQFKKEINNLAINLGIGSLL